MRRIGLVGVLGVIATIVLSSATTLGGRLERQDLRTRTFDSSHLSGPLVKVEAVGISPSGAIVERAGYGVIVDPTGLVIANAHVAAPDAPGLAARYWDPGLTASMFEIIVSVSPGAGQTPVPAYSATVAAADGYLDLAVLRLDATYPAGTAVEPGTLSLPAIDLASTDAVTTGTPFTFATYAEADATSVLGTEAGYTEITGSVLSPFVDPRTGSVVTSFLTDVVSPTPLSGGVVVDSGGGLLGLPRWYPGTSDASVNILSAALIGPIIDVVETDGIYQSPYTMLGTGEESLTHDGWVPTLEGACADPPPASMTSYEPGVSEIAARFAFEGMTDGEDTLVIWYDPVLQTLIAADLVPWEAGPSGDCYQFGIFRTDGQPLADGTYGLQIAVGPTLGTGVTAQTTVGEPVVGIQVSGRILDADTGQPIGLATFFILDQGVDPQTWYNAPNDDEVAASATTGADGTYLTAPPIPAGTYPFVVSALGYRPIGGTVTIVETGLMPDITLVASE